MRLHTGATWIVAGTVVITIIQGRPAKQGVVLRVIADQVWSEMYATLSSGNQTFDEFVETSVRAERLHHYDSIGELWKGRTTASHPAGYTVAVIDGKVFRLGGFPAPDLIEVSGALGPPAVTKNDIVRKAEVLVSMVEESRGLAGVITPLNKLNVTDSLWSSQRDGRPLNWPDEVITRRSDRAWTIVLTAIPKSAVLPPKWYVLVFDATGSLQSWYAQHRA